MMTGEASQLDLFEQSASLSAEALIDYLNDGSRLPVLVKFTATA